MTRLFWTFCTLFICVNLTPAVDIDFNREIAPILINCIDCHSGKEAKGGLDLSRKVQAFTGGDSGDKGIVAGNIKDSSIWQRVQADEMPPKKPLTANEKSKIKQWIEGGAKWGMDPIDPLAMSTNSRAGRDWWALQPISKTSHGTIKSGQEYEVIDHYINQKLKQNGLTLSPAADRRTLLRRLKFDLLGLPPTPEETTDFINDQSANAYEKKIDQYLASPHYGERWARHWLDTVRFAESNGFETNTIRSTAWHYRDWVIQSLNQDKPYDQFVFEQLAGDTVGADAATGFLVGGSWDEVKSPDIVLTLNQRADELHDIVSTTSSTFLGLTVGCARCHNHKFDPVPQLDYYRMKAVFAGVQHGEREIRTPDFAKRELQIQTIRKEITEQETSLAKLLPLADPSAIVARREQVNSSLNVERFQSVQSKFVRMVIFETTGLEPCIDELEIFTAGDTPQNIALSSSGSKIISSGDYSSSPDIHQLKYINDGKYGNSRSWISNMSGKGVLTVEFPAVQTIDKIVWSRDRELKFKDRLATRYRFDSSLDGKAWQVIATSDDRVSADSNIKVPPALKKTELEEWNRLTQKLNALRNQLATLIRSDRAYVGRFETPETTFRLHRGDPMEKRESIEPGVLSEVQPSLIIPNGASESERRVALAKWIINPANPLTARVMVNRIWQHHFGSGLVQTSSDFGFNGGRPSHPELLDWLAKEFLDHRWSMKHLHRLIVMSDTYRQSSSINQKGITIDAGTKLLWRYPPKRMEAEAIRDSILFASGSLDLKMGGPGFDLFEPNTNYVKVYSPKKSFGTDEYRRMIYQLKPRMQLDDTFGAFDCPDGGQMTPRRNSSTTPLQSLNLLNSDFLLQQADLFSKRIIKEEKDPQAQIIRVFQITFQRNPSVKELEGASALIRDHGLSSLCRAVLNANEFLYVD